jgi:hypothetical protein
LSIRLKVTPVEHKNFPLIWWMGFDWMIHLFENGAKMLKPIHSVISNAVINSRYILLRSCFCNLQDRLWTLLPSYFLHLYKTVSSFISGKNLNIGILSTFINCLPGFNERLRHWHLAIDLFSAFNLFKFIK